MKWDVDRKLELSPETMRALGYRVVDIVTENIATLEGRSVSRTASPETLEAALREPVPSTPRSPDDVLSRVRNTILENMIHVDHPRNFGFVPGPSNYVGAIADFLASGFNVFAGTWLEGSGAAEVELVTLDWLKAMCGLPAQTKGIFVSGGSAANLSGLLVARQDKLPAGPANGVWYQSTQTHSSMERAFRVLGFRDDQSRSIEVDSDFRISMAALERAVISDRRAGLEPFVVVANGGSTNTGAVDPLRALKRFCERENLWLHVDGAYGAAAALSPEHAPLLDGLGEADSLSLDPHKWLFQPYGLGCVFVRDGALLARHFRVAPDYLQDVEAEHDEVNFCDLGIELTREFRALKLWMTLQLFGLDNIREAITYGIGLAEHAERCLRERPRFEITSAAQLGVVSFRYVPDHRPDANAFQLALSRAVIEDGFTLASSTVLEGNAVLRICSINPRTTRDDIEDSIERIETIARALDRG